MNYVFTVRSVRKGKFTNEPGAMHFLAIPDHHPRFLPYLDWIEEGASSG